MFVAYKQLLFWLGESIVCVVFDFISFTKPVCAEPSGWSQWYAK